MVYALCTALRALPFVLCALRHVLCSLRSVLGALRSVLCLLRSVRGAFLILKRFHVPVDLKSTNIIISKIHFLLSFNILLMLGQLGYALRACKRHVVFQHMILIFLILECFYAPADSERCKIIIIKNHVSLSFSHICSDSLFVL